MISIKITRISDNYGIAPEWRVCDQELGKFSQYVEAYVKPGPTFSVIEVEIQVSDLVEVIKDAVRAFGRRLTRACGKIAPLWTEEYRVIFYEFKPIK